MGLLPASSIKLYGAPRRLTSIRRVVRTVIFGSRKDDPRSVAAQANLMGSSRSYGIKPFLWDQDRPNGRERESGWANIRAKPRMATVARFVARAIRLYEQEPGKLVGSPRLGVYVQRWIMWIRAGL